MSTPSPLSERPSPQRVVVELVMAVLAGALAYGISCLLVAPAAAAVSFGEQWQEMSEAPLSLYGQFPHRLLAPLLAHLLGGGGEGYVVFVRCLNVALLASVFYFCRWRRSAATDALLVTLAVAITAPVQMYKEHWVGYVDPLSFMLFVWSMIAARRPWLFWSLFLANLYNHELAVFLLPWLWFVRRQEDDDWRADAIGAGGALALYAIFYLAVKVQVQPTYSFDYYLAHPMFPGGAVAVWALAFVHCVVGFGPLLAVLAWHQHLREAGRERWHLWLVLASILAIFTVAFDWARFSNLLFLPLVIASVRVLAARRRNRVIYATLLVVSAGLFLVPLWRPWSATAWPTRLMTEPGMLLRTGVLVNLSPPGAKPEVAFGTLQATLRNWLPEVWPVLLPIVLIFMHIWLIGALLAWRRTSDVPAAN